MWKFGCSIATLVYCQDVKCNELVLYNTVGFKVYSEDGFVAWSLMFGGLARYLEVWLERTYQNVQNNITSDMTRHAYFQRCPPSE